MLKPVYHRDAFEALRNSGLVEDWAGMDDGSVRTTERGRSLGTVACDLLQPRKMGTPIGMQVFNG